jgi:NADH-quinone oxidoreductase subunit J
LISGGCLFLVLIAAVTKASAAGNMVQMGGGNSGLIKNLGNELFRNYVIPFEISSVLFLSAMVGAVVIGKKEKINNTN